MAEAFERFRAVKTVGDMERPRAGAINSQGKDRKDCPAIPTGHLRPIRGRGLLQPQNKIRGRRCPAQLPEPDYALSSVALAVQTHLHYSLGN